MEEPLSSTNPGKNAALKLTKTPLLNFLKVASWLRLLSADFL